MFGRDRGKLRQRYVDAWNKQAQRLPLEPLENMIVQVIRQHPEYHALLEDPGALHKDFTPEQGQTNPFLHMGMHLGLAEQLSTDRPQGIRAIYQKILRKQSDPHTAEHYMLDCLGLSLWQAQRQNRAPDEAAYLECLKKLV